MRTEPTMPRVAWIFGALGALAILAAAIAMNQPREPRGDMELLNELLRERTPHPVASAAGDAQAAKVARMLADAIGAGTVIDGDASTPLPTSGPVAAIQRASVERFGAPVKVANVLGRIRGRAAGPATMLVAHHDSVAAGPGAGDDGSGVVSVLLAARELAKEGTQRDVIFLLTDGEEAGLLGAIAFCAEHPWFDEVGSVVNIDSRGASGPCHIYQIGYDERALVQVLSESVPRPIASSLANEVAALMPNATDFLVFEWVGMPGINLACIGDVKHYHQPSDLPENFHPGTLGHLQETMLALARGLDRARPIEGGVLPGFAEWRSRYQIGDPTATKELRAAINDRGMTKAPRRPEPSPQSFASFWQRWTLAWDAGLSPFLATAALVAVLLGATILWGRGLLACGPTIGAVVALVLAVLASSGAAMAAAWTCSLIGAREGSGWTYGIFPPDPWPWLGAVWAAAVLPAAALWQFVPRRAAWANAVGAVLLLSLVLCGLSVAMPAVAAMVLPIVGATAIVLLLASTLPRSAAGFAAGLVACVQLWALGAVLFPLVPALQDAMGFRLLPMVLIAPLLTVLAFTALLPGARGRDPAIEPWRVEAPARSEHDSSQWRPA
ncbi:MAG: M20/M25/M40 family metallo-hydrolase [Phycisphaerae bacterium]|nr:M20/M25/M40 family metallo-hydrolase [Phycisphaerae bacterium]